MTTSCADTSWLQEQRTQLHSGTFQTIEDFILLSHNTFATAVFSTTHVAENEGEDFDLLTQLVVYGLAENSSEEAGSDVDDRRRPSHQPKEVSSMVSCLENAA